MQVKILYTIGHTTTARITADEGETLTREAIEERFFHPFGGSIQGMTETVANVVWYED